MPSLLRAVWRIGRRVVEPPPLAGRDVQRLGQRGRELLPRPPRAKGCACRSDRPHAFLAGGIPLRVRAAQGANLSVGKSATLLRPRQTGPYGLGANGIARP